jgi:hypothetical protein
LSFNDQEGQSRGLGADLDNCNKKGYCAIGLGNQWYSMTMDYDPEHVLDSLLDTNSLGIGLESHLFENTQRGASHQHGLSDFNDHEYGFVLLEHDDIYEGPAARADPHALWDSRSLGPTIHNYNTYKIPVASDINIEKFQALAIGHWDQQIFHLLRYGLPLNLDKNFNPSNILANHASADRYLADIDKYINTEVTAQALWPLNLNTLPVYHVSPLMSPPKEGSSHQVIVDLPWPKDQNLSINSCVSTDSYLDKKKSF